MHNQTQPSHIKTLAKRMKSKYLLLTTVIITSLSSGNALAKSGHEVYGHTGISTFSKDGSSESGLYTQAGYNYFFTPFVALDINYTRASSFNTDVSQNNTDFTSDADGFGAGVKLIHYFGRLNVQAKGGVSSLKVTQDYWDNNQLKFVETSDRTTSPYFEVGVGMLSPWSKRLSVNLNYNYQIANDDIDISSFSLSGNYTF